jgi:hypothetical protein
MPNGPEDIKDFMTPATILTYAGASLVVLIVSNAYRILLKKNSPWPCFIIAIGVSVLVASIDKATKWDGIEIAMVFINGCMLFYSAAGLQGWTVNIGTPGTPAAGIAPHGRTERPSVPWLSKWL